MTNIIRVEDTIKYKPTDSLFTVKEIYAGADCGKFNCAGGEMEFASAVLVFYGDSGHYPVDKDIELIVSKNQDWE